MFLQLSLDLILQSSLGKFPLYNLSIALLNNLPDNQQIVLVADRQNNQHFSQEWFLHLLPRNFHHDIPAVNHPFNLVRLLRTLLLNQLVDLLEFRTDYHRKVRLVNPIVDRHHNRQGHHLSNHLNNPIGVDHLHNQPIFLQIFRLSNLQDIPMLLLQSSH